MDKLTITIKVRLIQLFLTTVYVYIRDDLFSKLHIITNLTSKLVNFLSEKVIGVIDSTKNNKKKKYLSRNLKTEFGESLHVFTHNRRAYIRPHTPTVSTIACDYLDLKVNWQN